MGDRLLIIAFKHLLEAFQTSTLELLQCCAALDSQI